MRWLFAFLITCSAAMCHGHSLNDFNGDLTVQLARSKVDTSEITQEEAIDIARKKGYYQTGKAWREPVVSYNSEKRCWIIQCVRYETSHRGKCKHTNGCSIVTTKTLSIESRGGKVVGKTTTRKKFPNYE